MAFFHFCREADFMNMKCKQKLGGSPNFLDSMQNCLITNILVTLAGLINMLQTEN